MADLTYNQGIHGAQDQANALVRAGLPFSVMTGDWRSDEFERAFEDWARAAQAITALRRTRDRAARLPDERNGRHPLRPAGDVAARSGRRSSSEDLGPAGRTHRCGHRRRGRRGASPATATLFEVANDLRTRTSRVCRAVRGGDPRVARGQGLRGILLPLRLDRRRRALRAAAAARRLGPDGRRLRLRRRGRHQHHDADVRRPDDDRRRALLRDVRDGLGARLGADQPHGRGQLEDRPP